LVRLETQVDDWVAGLRSEAGAGVSPGAEVQHAVERLEATVQRFEDALTRFASSTGEFHQFNLHLKDNIQRMSLCFADLSNTLQAQVAELRPRPGRPRQ